MFHMSYVGERGIAQHTSLLIEAVSVADLGISKGGSAQSRNPHCNYVIARVAHAQHQA